MKFINFPLVIPVNCETVIGPFKINCLSELWSEVGCITDYSKNFISTFELWDIM